MNDFRPLPSVQRDVLWASTLLMPDHTPSFRLSAGFISRYMGLRVVRLSDEADIDVILGVHKPRIIAITKPRTDLALELFRRAHLHGIQLVSSFADWTFDGEKGEMTRKLAEASDVNVVQTRPMATAFAENTGVTPEIIEECLEYPRGPATFKPGKVMQLLWYGTENNHDTFTAFAKRMRRFRQFPIEITVMSELEPPYLRRVRESYPHKLTYLTWSPNHQMRRMLKSDIIVIPSTDTPEKRVKGHNRLIEALNLGRFPVAYALPQYEELSAYAWVGKDLANGLIWAKKNPYKTQLRIKAGQRYIDQRFSLPVVAKKWHDLFHGMLTKVGAG